MKISKFLYRKLIEYYYPVAKNEGWNYLVKDNYVKARITGTTLGAVRRNKKKEIIIKNICNFAAEQKLLLEFYNLSNELGFYVPVDYQNIIEDPEKIIREPGNSANGWQKIRDFNLLCLPQHYGIPTRLLDWTSNSLKAAFFAAENIDSENASGFICIYALKISNISTTKSTRFGIDYFSMPRYLNPYLHAQEGCFTVIKMADDFYIENKKWPTIDDALGNSVDQSENSNILIKNILPISECSNLIKILWKFNINNAHLMPNYDNVTKSVFSKLKIMHNSY